MADEYTPTDDDMVHWFEGEENPERGRALWDRWLAEHDARVRRAAAREALDGLARAEADMYLTRCQREDYRGAAWCEHARQAAEEYRDTHYPEETP